MTSKHQPTAETRAKVIGLSCNGVAQSRIAEHLGLAEKTLRLHYRQQLDFGTESLLASVLGNLVSIALRGKTNAAVSACKYLLSCRGGYRESARLEVEPTGVVAGFMMAGADNAREIIASRLDALAERHAARAARDAELEAASLPRPPLDS